MMKEVIAALVLILSLFINMSYSADIKTDKTTLGPLTRKIDGGGCSATIDTKSSDDYLIMSDIDYGNAWMHIDGKDIKLPKLTHTNEDSLKGSYSYKDLQILITEANCKSSCPESESCESETCDLKVEITRGKSTESIKMISECGH